MDVSLRGVAEYLRAVQRFCVLSPNELDTRSTPRLPDIGDEAPLWARQPVLEEGHCGWVQTGLRVANVVALLPVRDLPPEATALLLPHHSAGVPCPRWVLGVSHDTCAFRLARADEVLPGAPRALEPSDPANRAVSWFARVPWMHGSVMDVRTNGPYTPNEWCCPAVALLPDARVCPFTRDCLLLDGGHDLADMRHDSWETLRLDGDTGPVLLYHPSRINPEPCQEGVRREGVTLVWLTNQHQPRPRLVLSDDSTVGEGNGRIDLLRGRVARGQVPAVGSPVWTVDLLSGRGSRTTGSSGEAASRK
jgi:hypothetical protein